MTQREKVEGGAEKKSVVLVLDVREESPAVSSQTDLSQQPLDGRP